MSLARAAVAAACALAPLAACGGNGGGERVAPKAPTAHRHRAVTPPRPRSTPAPSPGEHRALATQAFVDSIGVNVHMGYTDTAYSNLKAVRAALRELGIRHVRDGVVVNRPDEYAALNALGRDGVGADLILGDPQGRFGTGTVAQQVETVSARLARVAESVEGPNEYDKSGGSDWSRSLAAYQLAMHDLVRADPRASALPVVAPSLADTAKWPAVRAAAPAFDVANLHWYPSGNAPTAEALQAQMALAARVSGNRPVWVTETGYHDAAAAPGGGRSAVSEEEEAAYLPRLLFSNMRAGAARSYLYELVDQRPDPADSDPEAHFGLVRNDFSHKPAFDAVRDTIALLADAGPAVATGSLAYSVRCRDRVEDLLLEKRDGTFYVALWRPRAAFGAPRVPATLRLPRRVKRVRVYDPVRSTRALASSRDAKSVSLDLGADALLVAVEPG
jgi:hypothetical protein